MIVMVVCMYVCVYVLQLAFLIILTVWAAEVFSLLRCATLPFPSPSPFPSL